MPSKQKLGTMTKRSIFLGDSLSQLLFALELISMFLVLREVKAGYQMGDIWGKVNQFHSMDDLMLYGHNKKQIDNSQHSTNILQRHLNGI